MMFHSSAGTVNVVTGDAERIGAALLDSCIVRKLSFTGSTHVGKRLLRGAADTVKRVSMELGGNAPFIVFDDADLPAAAKAVKESGLRNAGQTCICANRILVQVRSPPLVPCITLPGTASRACAGACPQVGRRPQVQDALARLLELALCL